MLMRVELCDCEAVVNYDKENNFLSAVVGNCREIELGINITISLYDSYQNKNKCSSSLPRYSVLF